MKYPNLELIEYISKQVLKDKDPSALYPTCTMYVFPQTWASTALGFDEHGGLGGQAFTSAYTTVVEIKYRVKGGGFSTVDDRYYAVFFDGRFAYMYFNPSEQFFKDLDKRFMKSQRGSQVYDEDYTGNEGLSF